MYSNRYIDSLYTFFIRVVSEATHSCIPTHTYKCLHTSHTYRHVNTKTEQGDWPRLPGECAKAPCLRGGANVPRGRAKTFRDAISLGLLCRSQRTVLRLRDTPAYIATNSCYRFCFDFFHQRRLLPSFPFFFFFFSQILSYCFPLRKSSYTVSSAGRTFSPFSLQEFTKVVSSDVARILLQQFGFPLRRL